MNNAILIVVGISHLVTSALLIRALDQKDQLEAANRKLRRFIERLIDASDPNRKVKR